MKSHQGNLARTVVILVSVLAAITPIIYIHRVGYETENENDQSGGGKSSGAQSSVRTTATTAAHERNVTFQSTTNYTFQQSNATEQERPEEPSTSDKQELPTNNSNTVPQTNHTVQPNDHSGKCEAMLDQMDAKFDARRQTRLELAKNLRSNAVIDDRFKFDAFEPEVRCLPEERFGGEQRYYAIRDGPKFVCGIEFMEKNDCLVYSVGSYNKVDFEQAIHTHFGCETHTFDPTLTEAFKGSQYATFHAWGLGPDGVNQNFEGHRFVSRSMATIVKDLGHEGRTLDILKIDCESCEWKTMIPVFQDIANGTFKVNQIQIEMHHPPWPEVFEFFEAVDNANMSLFHKERNHWGCRGYTCVEYAFVSNEYLRRVNSETVCNHRLDRTSDAQSCDALLDSLFDRFAHTRKMRNEFIAAGYKQSVTKVPFINYFFDPFESEALCFAKERFGSDCKNHKLGSGGKFTCGIDFIEKDVCNIYSYSKDQTKSFENGVNSRLNCFRELSSDEATKNLVETIQKNSTSGRADIVDLENISREALINLFDGIAKGQIAVDQLIVKLDSSGDFNALAQVFQSADKAGMLIVHKEYPHWLRVSEENDENKSFQFTFVSESRLRFINSQIACNNELTAASLQRGLLTSPERS